ncbi:MAG: GAF domain-containing protein [Deltaproteobacteria bacterium]|nr:GAF domain-containing protein [Deltaproteobacteria bacterium]
MSKTHGESKDHLDLTDLTARREEFLETFFRKGAEFAAELLAEMEKIRGENKALSDENAALRRQLASDDAIRDLLSKIEVLENEKAALFHKVHGAKDCGGDLVDKYAEVEKELDAMANLYVASYQLHATLEPQEVLGVIEQLLAQLVGTKSFAIYLRREDAGALFLVPVHAYHCDTAAGTRTAWGEGPIGEAAETQVQYVADPRRKLNGAPLACIPMVLGRTTVGVIAIFELFEQKTEFVRIDFELFKLLALHAASAIVGAGLFTRAGGVGGALDVYRQLG